VEKHKTSTNSKSKKKEAAHSVLCPAYKPTTKTSRYSISNSYNLKRTSYFRRIDSSQILTLIFMG